MVLILIALLFTSSLAVERVSLRAAAVALAWFGVAGVLADLFPSAAVAWGLLALLAGSATVLAGKE